MKRVFSIFAVLLVAFVCVLSTLAQPPARPRPLPPEALKRRAAGSAFQMGRLCLRQQKPGSYQLAIDKFNSAASIYDEIGDLANVGSALLGVGAAQALAGRRSEAAQSYNRAMAVFRPFRGVDVGESALIKLGFLYDELVGKRSLFKYDELAIVPPKRGYDQNGDRIDTRFSQLSERYYVQYFNQPFIVYYREESDPILDDPRMAGSNDQPKPVSFYKEVNSIWKLNGVESLEVATGIDLMESWAETDPDVAAFYGKQAINKYQDLRRSLRQEHRFDPRRYQNQLADKFRQLADLLIGLGRLSEANDVLQMLKEEEFSEFVQRDANEIDLLRRKVRLTPKERQLIDRYLKLAERAAEIGEKYKQLEAKKKTEPLSDEEERQRSELELQTSDVNAAFKLFLEKELVKEVGLDGAKLIGADRDLQDRISGWGDGAVSLYTVVTENRYRVILTTPTVQIDGKTDISATVLNKKIFSFRRALQDPDVDPRPMARELYDILIKPVEKALADSGAKTLVWSLDGTLRYIPMAALSPDGQTYMVERYQNVTITTRTRERLSNDTPAWTALGMGISEEQTVVYPERPGQKVKVDALPGTKDELMSIIRDEDTPGEKGILPGRRYLDAAFTIKNLTDSLAKYEKNGRRKFSVVHLASHFYLGSDWSSSYLFLGGGKLLTLEELTGSAAIDFSGVDLVTLSACDTAIATATNGAEVDSLAEAIQAKSGKAVLATLWKVSDLSTPQLMGDFYRFRNEKSGTTKAEALQQAQRKMIASATKTASGFSHPYFWSGFVLIGNWR